MDNFSEKPEISDSCLTIENCLKEKGQNEYVGSILDGLQKKEKTISSIFFYDDRGSKLFENITRLSEYYLTRTEKELIRAAAAENREKLKDADIVEIGSGDYSKISILLEAAPQGSMESLRYIPVDISYAAIKESAGKLLDSFEGLNIHALVADFVKQLNVIPDGGTRIICFFGSTLGNFSRKKAQSFISELGDFMKSGDMLFVGLDMIKSKAVLEMAYNDSQNVTAEFNCNILNVINSIIGTDFNPASFRHIAFYNEKEARIEMYLEAEKDMEVSSPHFEEKILIQKGERIHTENSHKFSREDIYEMAEHAGLETVKVFSDDKDRFSLAHYYKK
ncbi:MAG: L-histidine N(alpha)-methyltransferase [Elusimicrobia bacterium]|nr:L-histidine N(alpha)-methyltransferase [Elusimicrobiota bacterium]